MIVLLLFSFLLSVTIVPYVADAKGRSAFGWALLSLLFSPIVTLIALAALPRVRRARFTSRGSTEEPRRAALSQNRGRPMRVFAVLLILLGPVIAISAGIYAVRESDRRLAIWVRSDNLVRTIGDPRRRVEVARIVATADFAGTKAALATLVSDDRTRVDIVSRLRAQAPQLDPILKNGTPEEVRALLWAIAPSWTGVDPWPGILIGAGCSAFGTLLLAIMGRRPRREEEPPDHDGEVPEFKWRKG
jgi:hypothetical protein